MPRSIWYAEDDPVIAQSVMSVLEAEGYEVTLFATGLSMRNALAKTRPDLAIIDWNLPDDTGIALCTWLRSHDADLPVLMLTVHDDPSDIVLGIECGADDYVTKPFDIKVLVARIHALLRRNAPKPRLTCGNISLDISSGTVTKNSQAIELSALEYRLLVFFLQHKGKLVTRAQLQQELWEHKEDGVSDNAISVAVKRLRAKLGDDLALTTIRGIGYRLEGL